MGFKMRFVLLKGRRSYFFNLLYDFTCNWTQMVIF